MFRPTAVFTVVLLALVQGVACGSSRARGEPVASNKSVLREAGVDATAAENRELLALYEEDQADRSPATAPEVEDDGATILERDARRRERVRAIVASGGARVSADYFHAAMVFQHGTMPEEITRAYELAMRATELTPTHPKARWLAAAATDRRLMYLGKPQLYGTQFRVEDCHWRLYTVDPTVSDDERARWGVPSLAEARKQIAIFEKMMPPCDADGRPPP